MAVERRPAGFLAIGIFFFFGAVMATYAAITLLVPGTFLDQAWKLNPEGHAGLSSLGRIMAAPLMLLALMLFLAGLGWFRRRSWGWKLGIALLAINLIGDVFNLLFRPELLKGGVGVAVAALLLIYMTRAVVRNRFRRNAS